MPRYAVHSLRITKPKNLVFSSGYLKTKTGRLINLPLPDEQNDSHVLIINPTRALKHYFSTNRFVIQSIFSLLLTVVVCVVREVITRSGGVKEFFSGTKNRLFWWLFLGAVTSYSIWLLAFWPGLMSVDSLNIWRAAWLPDVMINNHPALNVFWYMFLLHLWNNIAVVPISQIFFLSGLVAATFFFCYRQGVRLKWLLPSYCLLLLSLPIGLYNVTLWKDVPFALLLVFWSLLPAWLYFKKTKGEKIQLTCGQIAFLVFSFLALFLIRHNGVVYIIVLPVVFIVLRLMKISRVVLFAAAAIAIILFLLVLFPPKAIKGASYFHDLSRMYLQQLELEPSKRIIDAVQQYPRLLDLKKNKKQTDFWHYYLGDRYAYTFLRDVGWNDTFPYLPPNHYFFPGLHKIALFLYKHSLTYPWVYFTWNPFWILYFFPLSILLWRWFPLSAIFSSVILVQVIALLVFVGTVNWRYYYFVLLGGYFLLPVILLDLRFLKHRRLSSVS